jgi:thiosulfate/3-mercaptopyruvate sulfurtransferase
MSKFFLSAFFLFAGFLASAQTEKLTKDQLIQAADLAAIINSPTAKKPLIFNVGPMGNIKGAVATGLPHTFSGSEALTTELNNVPKNREIIIYCGCCSTQSCGNIRTAFDLVKKLGYKKVKCLDIMSTLGDDWISKKYPME